MIQDPGPTKSRLGSGESLALPKGYEWVVQARAEYYARLEAALLASQELRALPLTSDAGSMYPNRSDVDRRRSF